MRGGGEGEDGGWKIEGHAAARAPGFHLCDMQAHMIRRLTHSATLTLTSALLAIAPGGCTSDGAPLEADTIVRQKSGNEWPEAEDRARGIRFRHPTGWTRLERDMEGLVFQSPEGPSGSRLVVGADWLPLPEEAAAVDDATTLERFKDMAVGALGTELKESKVVSLTRGT